MHTENSWRQTFCGRQAEMATLMTRFREVASGQGPRVVTVLADRGMGKTRLVQEFYRELRTSHDGTGYWPDAGFFRGNNLRVAPDITHPEVAAHYASFGLEDRRMSYLWWGFRLADPEARNTTWSDMAGHRATLDPHLAPVFYARRYQAARKKLNSAGAALGRAALLKAIQQVPVLGLAASGLELFIEFSDHAEKGRDIASAVREMCNGPPATLTSADKERGHDILQKTVADLEGILAHDVNLTHVEVRVS